MNNLFQPIKIEKIHEDDINCVDWNILNENYIASGSSDGMCSVIDMRMRKILYQIKNNENKGMQKSVQCVSFCDFDENILGVGSDSLRIYNMVFNIEKIKI